MNSYVFAYGSNMCSGRLAQYDVVPKVPARSAVLHNYRLCFNKISKDGSGKANVEPQHNSEVWGVLYAVTENDLEKLDEGEGAGYRRTCLPVAISDGDVVTSWVYVATNAISDSHLRPYTWYVRFLVEGAKASALPDHYVAALDRVAAETDLDTQRDSRKRRIRCD